MTLETTRLIVIIMIAFIFGPMLIATLAYTLSTWWKRKKQKKERDYLPREYRCGDGDELYNEEEDITDCLEHEDVEE